MLKNVFGFGIALLIGSSLTACVNLKPVKTPDTSTYTIDTAVMPEKGIPSAYSILITTPKSGPGLTGNHIAYIQQPHEISYFSHNRWIDTPANMILPLMVQTLQNSNGFQAVVATPYSGETDLRLDTSILALQQEFTNKPSLVRLTVRAQLINLHTQRVMATQVFQVVQPATTDNPYGGVKAANKAVAKFLTALSQFCITNTRNMPLPEYSAKDKELSKKR